MQHASTLTLDLAQQTTSQATVDPFFSGVQNTLTRSMDAPNTQRLAEDT